MATEAGAKVETAQDKALKTFSGYLKAREQMLRKIIPSSVVLDPGRMIAIALSAASRSPDLLKCSAESLYLCLHQAAQLGMEPGGPLGHFYLIPRWNGKIKALEAAPLIGYKGYVHLGHRSGQIRRMDACPVYAGEYFEVSRGLHPDLIHRWNPDVSRGPESIVAAYAIVITKDGGEYFEVLTRGQVEERRHRGATGKDAEGAATRGPWATDYAAMARKSALRALFGGGLVPMSAELQRAIAVEDALDAGGDLQSIVLASIEDLPVIVDQNDGDRPIDLVVQTLQKEGKGALPKSEPKTTEPVPPTKSKGATEKPDDPGPAAGAKDAPPVASLAPPAQALPAVAPAKPVEKHVDKPAPKTGGVQAEVPPGMPAPPAPGDTDLIEVGAGKFFANDDVRATLTEKVCIYNEARVVVCLKSGVRERAWTILDRAKTQYIRLKNAASPCGDVPLAPLASAQKRPVPPDEEAPPLMAPAAKSKEQLQIDIDKGAQSIGLYLIGRRGEFFAKADIVAVTGIPEDAWMGAVTKLLSGGTIVRHGTKGRSVSYGMEAPSAPVAAPAKKDPPVVLVPNHDTTIPLFEAPPATQDPPKTIPFATDSPAQAAAALATQLYDTIMEGGRAGWLPKPAAQHYVSMVEDAQTSGSIMRLEGIAEALMGEKDDYETIGVGQDQTDEDLHDLQID